jgi:hypothetical protein
MTGTRRTQRNKLADHVAGFQAVGITDIGLKRGLFGRAPRPPARR